MKILYVAPENVSGGFDLFVKGHIGRGNTARWVTFFPNKFGFKEDLCFNLRGMPNLPWVSSLRKHIAGDPTRPLSFDHGEPFWSPSPLAKILHSLRDTINSGRIRQTIATNGLNDFDIYHFEQGIDPFRNGRWVKELSNRDKGIVCFYHGTDIRNRGIIRAVHQFSRLNITSEIDLLSTIHGMRYLYLPIDTTIIKPHHRPPDGKIRLSHAARNRKFKGSDQIESVVKRLSDRYPIEWTMIENVSHSEALKLKSSSDIFIDQITDLGGWGYGASSVESLALGIPTVTRINPRVSNFLGEHPFINADESSLESVLIELISDESRREYLSAFGRSWVEERHGLNSVMETLYGYYRDSGLM